MQRSLINSCRKLCFKIPLFLLKKYPILLVLAQRRYYIQIAPGDLVKKYPKTKMAIFKLRNNIFMSNFSCLFSIYFLQLLNWRSAVASKSMHDSR